jgi:hypothetical protein
MPSGNNQASRREKKSKKVVEISEDAPVTATDPVNQPVNGEVSGEPIEPAAEPVDEGEELAQSEEEDEPETPSAPRSRGRPRRDELRATGQEFFDRWNVPDFENAGEYWVYRVEPITDRNATGKLKFIQIFHEHLNEDILMRHPSVGSGVYNVLVKIAAEPGAPLAFRGKLHRLEIENPAYPPCVEPGDWMEDHRNKRWAWAKKYYEARVAKENAAAQPQPTDAVTLLTTFDRMLNERIAKIETALSSRPKDDTVLQAVRTGIELAKPDKPSESTAEKLLLGEIQALRSENAKLSDRIFELLLKQPQQQEKPQSRAEMLEEMARERAALEQLTPRRGTVQQSESTSDRWLDLAGDVLKPLAEQAAPIIGIGIQRMMNKPPQPRPAAAAQIAPAAHPQQPQQAQPQPTQAQAQAPQDIASGGTITVDEPIPKVLADHFMMALDKCDKGWSGTNFAQWLDAGWPDAIAAIRRIGSNTTPPTEPVEAIIAIAKRISPIWAMVSKKPNGENRLRRFLAEIVTYESEADDDSGEEEAAS